MSASRLDSNESFVQQEEKDNNNNNNNTATPSKQQRYFSSGWSQSQSKIDITKETEEMNDGVILEPFSFSEQPIDNVFSSTVKLSAHS